MPAALPPQPEGYARCGKCKVVKTANAFGRNAGRPSGLSSTCRECRRSDSQTPQSRRRSRVSRFGLTLERFQQMLADQGGVCAICGKAETHARGYRGTPDELSIDHDHSCCAYGRSCGRCVRGLICAACNRGLAAFHDDPDILAAAALYLLQSTNLLVDLT